MSGGRVLAVHIRRGGNIGDLMSGPADYFDFGRKTERVDVQALLRNGAKAKPALIVAGGGAWKKNLAAVKRLPALRDVPKVAWGVGVTSRKLGPMPAASHQKRSKGWTLYAHRDVGLRGRYVPCASCMHPAFDKAYSIEHEVVYYGHGLLAPMTWAKNIGPLMTNQTSDMAEVIAFLGSGSVIATSSYHGAYWGRLLERHVVMIPRGSKFWHVPGPRPNHKPWKPNILGEHRRLNREFHADVLELLEAQG